MAGLLRVPGFDEAGFGDALAPDERAPIAQNAFFAGLPDASRHALLATFRTVSLPHETLLYVRGQRAHRVFLIVRGSVALVQRTAGLRTEIVRLGAGTFSGEGALMQPRVRHPWTASCVGEVRLAFADGDDVRAAVAALPNIGFNVARALHDRVADAGRAIGMLSASRQ